MVDGSLRFGDHCELRAVEDIPMRLAFITRGKDQQLDYNVIEDAMPWGKMVAAQMQSLSFLRTSPSDYSFSFVVRRDKTRWEVLVNAIKSARKDFNGSPLRTDLYMSGDVLDEDYRKDIQLASNIIIAEISDYWPLSPVTESRLGKCLDEVLTDDVIRGIVSWKGEKRVDAVSWCSDVLSPALKSKFARTDELAFGMDEISRSITNLLGGVCGVVSGEFLPYYKEARNKIRNFTFHFPDKKVLTVTEDGANVPKDGCRKQEEDGSLQPRNAVKTRAKTGSQEKMLQHFPWWIILTTVAGLVLLAALISNRRGSKLRQSRQKMSVHVTNVVAAATNTLNNTKGK